MEHTKGIVKDINGHIYPHEYEQASNSYLMAVVAIIAGLPLPIINFIAAVIFYLGSRKSTYFVRWHSIQSALGQLILIPFNSIAVAWTLRVIFSRTIFLDDMDLPRRYYTNYNFPGDSSMDNLLYYWLYISFIFLLNIAEFIVVIYTASRVRKGRNVRWIILANLADSLTSKENRDPYRR